MKLVKNVVPKRFTFSISYKDGRSEERTVEAESKEAAFLMLQSELWDKEPDAKVELKS